MKKIATLALCVLMLALTAPVIQAATPQAGAPKADKPAKVDARSTPGVVRVPSGKMMRVSRAARDSAQALMRSGPLSLAM